MTRLILAACVALLAAGGRQGNTPAKPAPITFAAFVDSYLDAFARRHPSIASGNGIHDHDDLL